MTRQRILVVGGTGFVGSHTAHHLADLGHDVEISTRSPARQTVPGALPQLSLDYLDASSNTARALEGFDTVVFAAGSDIRHVAAGDDDAAFWRAVQEEGVPAFAALARQAHVGRFVQIGSYYHQVVPDLVESSAYVRARKRADDGARALTTDEFAAITLNPPSIVGTMPGQLQRRFARLVAWARGEVDDPKQFAPTGGTNYMSVRSVAQAVAGAIERGQPGRAYLIGDENLTFQQFFQLFADEAGGGVTIEERDEEHRFQPDRFIVQGRGNVIRYEPAPEDVQLLGYDRRDVRRAVHDIVAAVDAEARTAPAP